MAESKFKYTKGNAVLTEEQRQFYEDNGYLIIKKLVSEALLDECKQRFIDICDGKVKSKDVIIMRDISLLNKNVKGEHQVEKIQDFVWDEVLFKFVSDKQVVDIAQDIIGPNISTLMSMLINKPPTDDRDASRHPLHQDTFFHPLRPAEHVVGVWTAMEKINEQNGCLFLVPGSHKGPVYKHEYPENVRNKIFHGVFGLDYLPRVNLIMEKGDTVFFHPTILHGSGPNLTRGFRKAISCHYVDSNVHIIDVKGTIQEQIAVEFEQLTKKQKGYFMKFEDHWIIKNRLIRGPPGFLQQRKSSL